jgi:hypothetical protein
MKKSLLGRGSSKNWIPALTPFKLKYFNLICFGVVQQLNHGNICEEQAYHDFWIFALDSELFAFSIFILLIAIILFLLEDLKI